MLREKARQRTGNDDYISFTPNDNPVLAATQSEPSESEHVNFFKEVEDGTAEYKKSNKEYEKEKKEEQEKYEKQIGYLTYLGQDTNEMLKKQSWYEQMPDRSGTKGEVNLKSKIREDPLNVMKKFTEKIENNDEPPVVDIMVNDYTKQQAHKKRSKHKKHHKEKKKKKDKKRKRRSSSGSESEDEEERIRKKQRLEVLRLERLKREAAERLKAQKLVDKLSGKDENEDKDKNKEKEKGKVEKAAPIKRKYNSQFNPELAKQNYEKHH